MPRFSQQGRWRCGLRSIGLGLGRGLKNNFAGGYMHHPDFLARWISETFDRHGHGQRVISVKVTEVG
jgi:hypothetical protein